MALRLSGLLKMPQWGIFLFNPAIRQRHFLRRFDHQRAQLGHPVIGHALNRSGAGDCRERFAMVIINAGGDAAQAERVLLVIERVAPLASLR